MCSSRASSMRRRTCDAQEAGTRTRIAVVLDEDARGDTRDVPLHVARPVREPQFRDAREDVARVATVEHDLRPALRRLPDQRVGVDRVDRGAEVPGDRPSNHHLVRRDPARARRAHREVARLLVRVHAPELRHPAAPPRGRRTASGRRVRGYGRLEARRGTAPSGPLRIQPSPIERSRIGLRAAEVTRPTIRSPARRGTPRSSAPPPFELESRPASVPAGERTGARALERPRSASPGWHGPSEPELGRRVIGQRVLTDVDVTLLQSKDLQRVETVRHDAERRPRLHERTPELRTVRTRMMQLERDLPDEPRADRAAGNARHGELPHAPCAGRRRDRPDRRSSPERSSRASGPATRMAPRSAVRSTTWARSSSRSARSRNQASIRSAPPEVDVMYQPSSPSEHSNPSSKT